MAVEGGKKRQAIAGASGAIEEAYRQGLAAHALKHNKVRFSYSICSKGVNHVYLVQYDPVCMEILGMGEGEGGGVLSCCLP